MFFTNLIGFRNMLCFLLIKQSKSNIKKMEFLFKPQFSFSDYVNFNDLLPFLLKVFLILFCALFPLFLGFFKYYKTHVDKEPPFEEDCYEALQEHVDFDDIETPFSSLSFRFQTYEEFLRTTENVDSVISHTSIERDFVGENCSNPYHDPDFELHTRKDPENSPPNNLNLTDDIRIVDSSIKDDDDDDIDEDTITETFEDDDFIKELQIEIMKARAKAKFESVLPSIPEESDYPIAMKEDLKPWKKKGSFNHNNTKTEFHKFHELYTQKMRKYDTLNYQKTFTKELKMMQSKGLVDSVSSKGFCGCRLEKKADARTGENREIEGELELVYVVQLWVSWEFIVWQYKKALEICGRDGYGSCRFNEVAEKFQHFKVMIQRFMENESFDEGSRIECYARTRIARRKLLQVPLLKEDDDNNEENAVNIDRLIEILQESIRILWQFIRADKLAHISTLKCHIEAEEESTSPGRSKILKQILLQKERKLKKIIKRRNCTLKNCKDTLEEDDPDDELYFLTMVDLKLVTRVLNMQRVTRDQLKWCHHKLSCISFLNGKIKTEHSSVFFRSP